MNNEVEFWRNRAATYGSANTTPGLGISEIERSFILEVIKEDYRIFDHGIGEGRLLPIYAEYKCKVTGFDVAEYPALRSNIQVSGINIGYILSDDPCKEFVFADNSFDLMISLSVLHHVKPENVEKVLEEITRLAPISIISSYIGEPLPIQEDSYMFSHNYTRLFVNAELKVEKFEQIAKTGLWILSK